MKQPAAYACLDASKPEDASGARDRDRARGCDPAKRNAPLWLRALIAVEHELQMKCELTLHEPRELTSRRAERADGSSQCDRILECIKIARDERLHLVVCGSNAGRTTIAGLLLLA